MEEKVLENLICVVQTLEFQRLRFYRLKFKGEKFGGYVFDGSTKREGDIYVFSFGREMF